MFLSPDAAVASTEDWLAESLPRVDASPVSSPVVESMAPGLDLGLEVPPYQLAMCVDVECRASGLGDCIFVWVGIIFIEKRR